MCLKVCGSGTLKLRFTKKVTCRSGSAWVKVSHGVDD